ncbi:MAG: hypothetical protein RL885_00990 [Planctomycetota bacterium]
MMTQNLRSRWRTIRPLLADYTGWSLQEPASLEDHLDAALEWIARAQDQTGSGGVARSYSLTKGWAAAYPETTGYIIPTVFEFAKRPDRESFRDRAIRMADWECEIQLEDGSVRAGTLDAPVVAPAVFNTGQVLLGWCRAYRETWDERYAESGKRAAEWLVAHLDDDGVWRRGLSPFSQPGEHTYNARTAWALALAGQVLKRPDFGEAAIRALDRVMGNRNAEGWFSHCCLTDNARPLLHTIAYTLRGLLEGGLVLGRDDYLEAARQGAARLAAVQRPDGSLAGRFDEHWRPTVKWVCLTGLAQTSIIWLKLFERQRDEKLLRSARQANFYLRRTQDLRHPDPGVTGGIKGAFPINAPYGSYEYLNWATKFFADALMLEESLAGALD